MINWSLYETRLTINGNSQRERLINRTKTEILNKAVNSPSCKTVSINGINDSIIIIDTKDPRTKIYNALPNRKYSLGNLVHYANGKWLITDINEDAEIYQSGTIKQCNHLFRFQNHTSTILEYWGIIESPQASLDEEKVVTVLSSKLKASLPYNDDTRKIHIDKRFFIETRFDKDGKEIPVIYKVNNIISSNTDYGNGKLLELTLEEVSASSKESIAEKIADYISPTVPPAPPAPDPTLLNCLISGSVLLKAGGSARAYEAKFYKADGTIDTTITPVWQLVCLPEHAQYFKTASNLDSISIQVTDSAAIIGTDIKLVLADSEGLYNPAEFFIKVVSLF